MAANALASLALDRFVSASSAEDAHSSLEKILEALQNNKLQNVPDETPVLSPEMIWSDADLLNSLRHVLHTGKHKSHDTQVPVDEGASLVCKIYSEMVDQESTKSPLLDKDEALLECLIDVISSNNSSEGDDEVIVSMYTRVLALQFLTKLCLKRPSKAQTQLLQAPNGLHRLGDLLQIDTEEIIRNEALLLAQVIAEWPSCAKIWMFAEVADQVTIMAVEEGGLTKGNVMVQDCLDLLFKLWKHDPNLADLVFQSPVITDNLPRLLDLRKGTEFLNPPKKTTAAKKDDDLDDILKSASAPKEPKDDGVVVPHLTENEEKVIEKTLDVLALLLESDSLKESVWRGQMNLCSLIWELSLVSPPPPQVPYVCAVPSPKLQQKALETVALYFHDPNTMERHAGLDRLLYLVCTGGLGTTLEEKMGVSQGSLHVIRKTVSLEAASQMLMYSLAPPMSMDGEDQPPPPTVVHKLLNTVAENLTPTPGIDADRRKIFLAGALGGLSIFLTDQTSREVMLRLTTTKAPSAPSSPQNEDGGEDDDDNATTTTSSLIESMLHAVGTMQEAQNPEDVFFSMTLLRFLCHWTVETPAVVQAILSSNQSSIVLSSLLSIKTKNSNKKGVAVLGKLLLGLAMEYMGTEEEKCGGWTRASIMELIAKKSGGVSKFTSSLEQFKSVRDFGNNMPWSLCDLEYKVWSQWFANCVLLVRKRVVQELTGSGEGEDGETDDEGAPGDAPQTPGASGSARSLQKLVYQQSQEIDELQESLQKANAKIKTQDHEITEYKRRVESAPSQLDNMLDEYSAKITQLEASVASEVEEKKSIVEKNILELKGRDDQIAALQKELEESKAREKEARDESETMREEIESLSQAYTALEREYRQQQRQEQQQQEQQQAESEITTTTSQQQAGEQEQESAQPQQRLSSSSAGAGSTEISALRAENERLRSDAQAADSWMAMAVEKMRVLGQQNAGLQQELSQLRDGQAQSELQQQYNALYGEHQSLIQQHGQLQAHLDGLAKENHEVKLAIQQAQEHRMHLDQQVAGTTAELQSTTTELQSTISALEESRSEASTARADFQSKLETITADFEKANAEVNRLTEQLNHEREGQPQVSRYEADLDAKSNELERVNAELEGQTANADALRAEVAQLRDQINQQQLQQGSAKGESEALTQATATFEETVASKNAEVDQLKSALDRGSAELEGLRLEVGHLREQLNQQQQNHAATNTRTDETMPASRQEVEDLKKALESQSSLADMQMRSHTNEVGALNTAMGKLQQDLEATRAELDNVHKRSQEEIQHRESRIRELEANNKSAGAQTTDGTKQLEMEIAELKAANDASQEWMAKAVEHQGKMQQDLQATKAELESVRKREQEEIHQRESRIRELETNTSGAGAQTADDSKQLEAEIAELKEANDAAQEWMAKAVEHHSTLSQQVAKLGSENLALASQVSSLTETISNKEADLAKARAKEEEALSRASRLEEAETSLTDGKRELESQGRDVAQLSAEAEQLRAEAAHFTSTLQEQASVLEKLREELSAEQASKAAMSEEVLTLTSALKEKTVNCEQLSSEVNVERESKNSALTEVASSKEKVEQLASELQLLRENTESLGEGSQKVTELFNQLQLVKEENAVMARSQKDDKSEIIRLNDEISTLRGSVAAPSSEVTKGASAQNFFGVESASGVPSGASASQPESAKELFGAPAQAAGGAQDFFGAAPPSGGLIAQSQVSRAAGAQDFFGAAPPSAGLSTHGPGAVGAQDFFGAAPPASAASAPDFFSTGATSSSGESAGKESRANASPAQSAEKVKQLEGRLEEYEKTKQSLVEKETVLRERVSELETSVNKLQGQLKQVEEEKALQVQSSEEKNVQLSKSLENTTANSNVGTVAETHGSQLQQELEETKNKLSEALERLEDDDNVVLKWEERVTELEALVKDLEEQLVEQEESANAVIEQWQESWTSMDEKNKELQQMLEASGLNPEHDAMNGQGNKSNEIIALQNELEQMKAVLMAAQGNSNEGSAQTLLEVQTDLEQTKAALAAAQVKLEEDDSVVVKWEARVAGLESAIGDMEVQLREQEENASAVIAKWQDSCNALEEKNAELLSSLESFGPGEPISIEGLLALQERLRETESALAKAKDDLKDDDDVVLRWQERVAELEAASKEFATQMGQQEEDAKIAITKWQESCNALVEQSQKLTEQLEASHEKEVLLGSQLQETQKELEDAKASLRDDEISLAKWQERVSDLEKTVKDLQAQLRGQAEEAQGAIQQLQANYDALEQHKNTLEEQNSQLSHQLAHSNENETTLKAKLDDTQNALEEARQKLKDDQEALSKGQERVSELEGQVEDLTAQLHEQEDETKEVIAKWQGGCTALEEEKQVLNQHLQVSNETSETLQTQLQEAQRGLEEADQRIKDDEDVVMKWQGRVAELEATVEDLQAQLSEQEKEAENAISQWQESFSSLEGQKSELAQQLAALNDTEASMKTQMEETQKALEEAKDNLLSDEDAVVKWQERVTELDAVVKDLETQLSEQEEEANSAIAVWQENWTALEERNAELVESMEIANEQSEKLKHEAVSAVTQKLNETETALAAAKEELAGADENTAKLQEHIKVLESAKSDMVDKMRLDEEEAKNTATELQQTLASLEHKNNELSSRLNDANKELESAGRIEDDSKEALNSLQAELDETKRTLAETTEKEHNLQEQITELEATINELEEQLKTEEEEAKNVIEQWEQSYKALGEQNEHLSNSLEQASVMQQTLRAELDESKQSLSEARSALDEGNADGVVSDLQMKVEELEQQLEASEEEASSVIAQWQETVASLEASKKELSEELQRATEVQQSTQSQLTSLSEKLKETEDSLSKAHSSIKEEESSIADLKERLKNKEEELRLTEDKFESLEAAMHEKAASLEDLSERAEEDELVVKEWEKRTHELEAQINEQKAELEEQENEASNAISKWQERCTQLEEEKNELSRSLEAALKRSKDVVDENDSLESSSHVQLSESVDALTAEKARANDLKEQLAELESMVNLLQQRLLDSEKGSTEFREQIAELESMVNVFQQRLLDSGKEATAARDRLQEASNEYNSKNEELLAKLQEAHTKIESLESAAQSSGDTVDLEAKVLGLAEQMKNKDKEMADSVAEWQQHCIELESKNTELSNKLEALTADPDFQGSPEEHIAELETQIISLEQEIEEAGGVVSSWQESYQALEARNGELESELAAQGEASGDIDGELKAELNDLKSKLATSETVLSALQELETTCALKDEELAKLSTELAQAKEERDKALAKPTSTVDDDSWSMQDISVDNDSAPGTRPQPNATTTPAPVAQALSDKVKALEAQVEDLNKERDTLKAELDSAKQSSLSLMAEYEESKKVYEEVVNQWTESNKHLEAQVSDLEQQLEEEHNEAREAISSWEARCTELEQGLAESQTDLAASLKAQLEVQDKLLSQHSDSYQSDEEIQGNTEISVDVMLTKLAEKQALVLELVSKKTDDINTLSSEVEQLKSTSKESQAMEKENTLALNAQIETLTAQIAEKESSVNQLKASLASDEGVASHVKTLESKIATLEQQVEEERLVREEMESDLYDKKDRLSKFVREESVVKLELADAVSESGKLREAEGLIKSQLEEAKAENSKLQESESQARKELEAAKAENDKLRKSESPALSNGQFDEQLDTLQSEKSALEEKVEMLSKQVSELTDELQDANNAVQVFVAKDVSDRATSMAAHALREQLHDIRRQADTDRAAYASEREARVAAEAEVERLRSDLFALVDITDQENELYGVAALTIKATDKIHRKERCEITELRKSLTRALEELRTSRAAERDAEERAAKAAHHVAVCEGELSAVKSDMTYLIQTMDQMRQDEASRRASMENRIRTLENDHDVLRRFHSSETDSLRSELTQAVLEKDRSLQLLKDSEKNNAALLYAASKEYPASESPEKELAKLRIEKAQLLVAAAEEGERTERRLREVIATEVSSAEADILVERERRLAAEAASENMKLLIVELQKDVQAYKDDMNLGTFSPRKAKLEQENERLRQDIARLNEESVTLQAKLDAAESGHENANYRIEKLEAECRMAQASSNRLDREIRFHSEVQAEMNRMRSSASPRVTPVVDETAAAEKKEDDLRTVELYDKIQEQSQAMQRAREVHQSLQVEHEDLLALLAQQEEVKKSLEIALAREVGPMAVEVAIREAEENSIAQYGRCVRVSTP